MTPQYISICNDVDLFNYPDILQYFRDNKNVLNVTIEKDGNLLIDFIMLKNFIQEMDSKPNLYGICTMENETEWKLRYIGQRKSKDIIQRLNQHLIKKHKNTGAQLDKVNNELKSNVKIGIKLVSILPDELRHFYEEKLLKDIKTLDWNIQK